MHAQSLLANIPQHIHSQRVYCASEHSEQVQSVTLELLARPFIITEALVNPRTILVQTSPGLQTELMLDSIYTVCLCDW